MNTFNLDLRIDESKFDGYVGNELTNFAVLAEDFDTEYYEWLNEVGCNPSKQDAIPLRIAKLYLGDLNNRASLDMQGDPENYYKEGCYFFKLYERGKKQLEKQLGAKLPELL